MPYGPDGGFVSEEVCATLDRIAWLTPRHDPLRDPETRQRLHYEDVAVRALLEVASTCGSEERAAFLGSEHRGAHEDEAERIAREHGFTTDRLTAFRSLARSRGVELETVLRAALRGELRSVVERRPTARSDNEREKS